MNLIQGFRILGISSVIIFCIAGTGILVVTNTRLVTQAGILQEAVVELSSWEYQFNLLRVMQPQIFSHGLDQWVKKSETMNTKFLRSFTQHSRLLPESKYLEILRVAWNKVESEKRKLVETLEESMNQVIRQELDYQEMAERVSFSMSSFYRVFRLFRLLFVEWKHEVDYQFHRISFFTVLFSLAFCVGFSFAVLFLVTSMNRYFMQHMRRMGSLLQVKSWKQFPHIFTRIQKICNLLEKEKKERECQKQLVTDTTTYVRNWVQEIKGLSEVLYEGTEGMPTIIRQIAEHENFAKRKTRVTRMRIRDGQKSLLFEQPLEEQIEVLKNFLHQFSHFPKNLSGKLTVTLENIRANVLYRRERLSGLSERISHIFAQEEKSIQMSKKLDEIIDQLFVLSMNTAIGMRRKSRSMEGVSEGIHRVSEEVQRRQEIILRHQKSMVKNLQQIFVDIDVMKGVLETDENLLKELFSGLNHRQKGISIMQKMSQSVSLLQESYLHHRNSIEHFMKNIISQVRVQFKQELTISEMITALQDQYQHSLSWYQNIYAKSHHLEEYLRKASENELGGDRFSGGNDSSKKTVSVRRLSVASGDEAVDITAQEKPAS